MSDDYLSMPCLSCRSLYGEIHTNYECIVAVAKTTGTPLGQALREFRPPVKNRPPFAPNDEFNLNTSWDNTFGSEYRKEME